MIETDDDRLIDEMDNRRRNLLFALADKMEEEGEDTSAKGYRWLAEHDKWPIGRYGGVLWGCGSKDCDNIYDGSPELPKGAWRHAVQLGAAQVGVSLANNVFSAHLFPTYSSALACAAYAVGTWLQRRERANSRKTG